MRPGRVVLAVLLVLLALASGSSEWAGTIFLVLGAAAMILIASAVRWPSPPGPWRGWVPPRGVRFRGQDPTFEPPRLRTDKLTGRVRVRNVARGMLDGRVWTGWEQQEGGSWVWRFAVGLRERSSVWSVTPNSLTLQTLHALDSHHYSPLLPPEVQLVMQEAREPMTWQTTRDQLVATREGMTPALLPAWLAGTGRLLVRIADAFDVANAPTPRPELDPADPSRNVWTPTSDPAPEAVPLAWDQPQRRRRSVVQDSDEESWPT